MVTDTEMMKKMFDNADAIIYLKDEEGRFLYVNHRAAAVMRSTKDEVIGRSDADFFPKSEVVKIRRLDDEVKATGKPLTYEGRTRAPAGEISIVDHKFPVSIDGHANAVGGIAIEVQKHS